MPTLRKTLLALARLALLLPVVLCGWAWEGQTAENAQTATDVQLLVAPEVLKAKIEETTKAPGLEENAKNALLEYYRKSLDNLATAAAHDGLAKKFVQSIETTPAEIKKIRATLDKPDPQPPAQEQAEDRFDSVPLKEIEQQLLKAKASYTATEAEVAALTRQLAAQNERPVKAGQRLAEIKTNESALLAALKAPAPDNESPQTTEARTWLQQTQIQALHSETNMLNQELVSMPVLVELANIQREEAAARLERARSQMQELEAQVNRKRQAEATQSMDAAKEAMRQVADSSPVLQQAAARNAELGDNLQTVTAAQEHLAAEKDALDKESKRLEENFKTTKQKIELAGLNQALGLMLHDLRRTLPSARFLRKKVAGNQTAIAEAGLLQVQLSEERQKLDDVDRYAAELVEGIAPDELGTTSEELKTLLTSRRELLDKIIIANQSSLGLLAELETLYRQFMVTVASFDAFLAERLLWMRSTPAMRWKDFYNLPSEAVALVTPGPWLTTGNLLVAQAVTSPIFILACLATAGILWFRKSLLSRIETTVGLAGNPASYRFSLPIQAVVLTFLLALPGPLLIMILAGEVQTLQETTEFSRAIATGLIGLAYRFLLLRWLRTLLLPHGLADGFFHWPKRALILLRREAGFLMVSFLPAIFITQVTFLANYHAGGGYPLGRLLLIGTLSILLFFFYRFLHPRTGVCQHFLHLHSHQLFARIYPLFFFCSMLLPLALSGLVLAGYIGAVGALIRSLINSIWVCLGLVVCHQLIEHWLIQSSRRLSLHKAQGHSASAKAKAKMETGPRAGETKSELVEEPAEDLVELSTESRKLLDTLTALSACGALWLVWADVLPALRVFDEFTLWKYASVVNGQATSIPVTLADVGLTIIIGIVTLTATRRFPSLLKIVLLQHLGMSAGSRYTITTLSRYLIGGAGLTAMAEILGFSWSQIQWLVAALGVGIGFGLQEIVANFISGLIILFERPIRVGDVVTVGSTDGVVTRIRIRATTIRDFDGKELLVPNKEFISGQLLNWSLSDPVIRILLPVGVAYGSDVQAAMTLMKQAAEENALVLKEPVPVVTFDSFGDNALLLTLRCFIGSVDDRVAAKSVLHQVIDQKFREAEISMAFPQRDVHLDTVKPLVVRVVREEDADGDTSVPAVAD
jgi:potassium efflux system protein